MATRRCQCGTWFEYDALIRDEAVECPECGRILPRGDHGSWSATRMAGSLFWMAILAAVVLVAGGLLGALALVPGGEAVAGILALLGGVILGGTVLLLAACLRALAEGLHRLEDRIP